MSPSAKISLAMALLVACGHAAADHDSPKPAKASQPAASDLAIGELALTKVTDGDTIRVAGLDASLRLLGFDAEETFKSKADRRAFEAGWDSYKTAKRGDKLRPAKFATPLGEQAKEFAIKFFDGVDKVRLERDDPQEIRDRYDRYLAYVFVKKDGQWVNYNVEAVRAGMAPYFPKYGRSRRFHQEFVEAEAQAKANQLGIWAPGAQAYSDYPEREAWWAARGDFIEKFRNAAKANPNYIDVTHADALTNLEALIGKDVVVLGIVDAVRTSDKGPARVMLSGVQKSDFPLIFFDKKLVAASGIAIWQGEPVVVSGVPSIYENPHTHAKQIEIKIERASQIQLSSIPGLKQP
ncbi:MAG: hypothetical protein JWO36_961 [Myxococcales bacterium]|nr:hypothetical protein [Myxococcales bacterium]